MAETTAAERIAARGTLRTKLRHPIQAHGDELTELTLRRPTAGDMRQCDGLGDIAMTLRMISLCAGIPPSSVDMIDGADLAEIGEVLSSFLGNGQKTGKKA